MTHKATGPISPEEMQRIADLPYGMAAVELRKHDPLFGKKEGDKLEWRVRLSGTGSITATTIVEASSEAEAMDIAECRASHEFDWEVSDCDQFEAQEAEPA